MLKKNKHDMPIPIEEMITVQATTITPKRIVYQCPHCRGPRGKRIYHRHGNDGNMNDRDTETREPHCMDVPSVRGYKEVKILINDETARQYP